MKSNRKKKFRRSPSKRYVVFDLETGLIPERLPKKERVKAIRKLKVKCAWAYCSRARRYIHFTPSNISKLVSLIHEAEIIVGFNQFGFDYEVLVQHGLSLQDVQEKSVDLFSLIKEETGNWYSLDKLAKQNLGVGKISNRNLSAYCKHDVRLTHSLYKLWKATKLDYDKFRWRRNYEVVDDAYVANDFFSPEICPECGSQNIELNEDDFSLLSEGQMADRLAGFGGSSYCQVCGAVLEHG